MRVIVTDTETTGLDPLKDGILEIAGSWRDGSSHCFFETMCNPRVPISIEAMATHHITEDDIVKVGKLPDDALREMIEHLAGDHEFVFAAHNAAFDRGFISALAPELADPKRWICTYRCAMHLFPDAPGFSNQVLRYYLGLKPDLPTGLYPHRALYDVIVTDGILQKLLEQRTVDELIALSTQPIMLKTVRFGKHRGMLWKDVPTDYLRWILKQGEMDEDVRFTAYTLATSRQGRFV